MTKEQYQSFSLISLREMAKARGMTKISALRKEQLIEAMLRKDQADAEKSQTPVQEKKTEGQADSGPEGAVYAKRPEKEPDRAPETSREEQHPAGENRNRAVRANRQDSQREGSGAESGERASGGRTFTRRTQQRNQRRSLSSGRNENARNDYSRNENSRNENARNDYSRNENSRNERATITGTRMAGVKITGLKAAAAAAWPRQARLPGRRELQTVRRWSFLPWIAATE